MSLPPFLLARPGIRLPRTPVGFPTFPYRCLPDLSPGGHGGGAIPVPIPNTEVKPPCADDTAPGGRESRWPPGFFFPPRQALDGSPFLFRIGVCFETRFGNREMRPGLLPLLRKFDMRRMRFFLLPRQWLVRELKVLQGKAIVALL